MLLNYLGCDDSSCPKEEGVECEGCNGAGWLLCDFCKGKKNNVKSESSRIYRRCPTCKAVSFAPLFNFAHCHHLFLLRSNTLNWCCCCRQGTSFAQDAGSTNASLIQRAMTHEQK
ncbi:Os08g0520850 [Oryza sativa Japonica Group]|uniref:Os08g0520850 protein n=1 Tax=Oryza sativa subsp. japonica TaxID=39947 RepID=A0A0N7KQ58_ORYSJ|nr:hypothetical protein EE612_045426 [Oryza sativa]BAT06298.1 Os08g0520850 [Oryza sativa Japonica Group]